MRRRVAQWKGSHILFLFSLPFVFWPCTAPLWATPATRFVAVASRPVVLSPLDANRARILLESIFSKLELEHSRA